MHLNAVRENALIEALVAGFARSPSQLNGLHESDAELVRLPGTDAVLALTTDSIVEEIEAGLYADPYLIGWMTVIASASDLAAVGAEPVGLLLNETLTGRDRSDFLSGLQAGLRDACSACGLPLLGGDTNFSSRLQLSASALGIVPDGRPLTRLGCRPGDYIFSTGPFGSGSAYAFVRLSAGRPAADVPFNYRPQPRLREGQLLRRFASCCTDTSDGLLAALDQLARLNDVGFVLETGLETLVDDQAYRLTQAAGIPAWLALAGPHGEFELVFTLPETQVDALLAAASAQGWTPLRLGRVVQGRDVSLSQAGTLEALDTGRIRNLFEECGGDPRRYFDGLLQIAASRKGDHYHA